MQHNPLHYPTLDRCKLLTQLGFPETRDCIASINGRGCYCPSVMEMIDVIPDELEYKKFTIKKYNGWYSCRYSRTDHGFNKLFEGTLPNALADMIIWLVENNYLSFKK